jgi:hypothetical protein
MNAHETNNKMDQNAVNRFMYYAIVEFKTAESQMVGERDGKKVVRPISYTTPSRLVINQVATNGKTNGELGKDGKFTRVKFIISKNGHTAIKDALGRNGAPNSTGAEEFYAYLNENYYAEKFDPSESGVYACVDSTKVLPAKFSSEQKHAYEMWQSLNGQPSNLVTLVDNTLSGFDPNKIPEGYDKTGFNPKTLFEEGKNFKQKGF